jgi:hypothetical protein
MDGTLQLTRSTLDEVKVRQNRSRGSEEDEDDDDDDDDDAHRKLSLSSKKAFQENFLASNL